MRAVALNLTGHRPFRIRARWRLGQLLAEVERKVGRPGKSSTGLTISYKKYVEDLGTTVQTAMEAQRLGTLPLPPSGHSIAKSIAFWVASSPRYRASLFAPEAFEALKAFGGWLAAFAMDAAEDRSRRQLRLLGNLPQAQAATRQAAGHALKSF